MMDLFDEIRSFEEFADQACFFHDEIMMADLVDQGYELIVRIDEEHPGEGIVYRDRVAGAIDILCDSIEELHA